MKNQMITTIQNRISEMMKDEKIVSLLKSFSSEEASHEYIVKAAIATLVLPVSER